MQVKISLPENSQIIASISEKMPRYATKNVIINTKRFILIYRDNMPYNCETLHFTIFLGKFGYTLVKSKNLWYTKRMSLLKYLKF